jgi:hypothetical protein
MKEEPGSCDGDSSQQLASGKARQAVEAVVLIRRITLSCLAYERED